MQFANPAKLRRDGVLGMNRRNVAYIARYNERRLYPSVDNKLRTKLLARDAGLNTPELLHVVSTQRECETIATTLAPHDEFVIKPAQGSGGKGILVIVGRDGDKYVKSSGEVVSERLIKRHVSNIISGLHSLGGRTDVAIVETVVHSHPVFESLTYGGVPDIRLIVFKGYPVMGMLRLATRASDGKANLHQGAVGVGLDIGTGTAVAAVQYDQPITHHPDTKQSFDHFVVPNWQPLLHLAASCFEVTPLGYLGCDLVLDATRGALLLELNARPGLAIQVANQQGLLPRLRLIETLRGSAGPEQRVEFSMRHFSQSLEYSQPELPLPRAESHT